MSNVDSLRERGKILENQFFANLDAELLAELKAQVQASTQIAEFSRITGIEDQSVLEGLLKLGVTPSTIAALRVFPLVAVAWADGFLDQTERETVLALAETHLANSTGPAVALLKSWLTNKPSNDLLIAWETYAKELINSLPKEEAESVKLSLVEEIKTVASASGGLLGFASVSKGENAMMRRIQSALTQN